MRKVSLINTVIFLMLAQCSLKLPSESDLPSWSINLNIPLLDKTITIDDLLKDSLVVKLPYGSGDSIYAYQDEIQINKVHVGNKLNIADITQSIQQGIEDITVEGTDKKYTNAFEEIGVKPVNKTIKNCIGLITLEDTDPTATAPIKLEEIIDLSGIPEGGSTTINQSTPFPHIDRSITFEDFENANFSAGVLELKIINNLVLELGAPVKVKLLDADSTPIVGFDGDSAVATWTAGLQPGQSATATIKLANKRLPGTIIVRVTGVISGSAATNITNNTDSRNSAFVVEVQAKNLEVFSAKAKIPEQTIDTTSIIALDPSESNKVKTAVIREGKLRLHIANSLPINANLDLTITSLKTASSGGAQSFTATINLPAKQVTQREYNLVDDVLELDLTAQELQYYYTIHTIPTDPDKITVSSNDSVKVAIDIYGTTPGLKITFSEIEGLIEPQDIRQAGEINTRSSARISWAAIASGIMSINIDNRINLIATGVPHLKLDLPQIVNSAGSPLSLEFDLLPGLNAHNLDLSSYKIQPLSQPVTTDSVCQYITYQSRVTTPAGELARYNLRDSINVDIQLSEIAFQSVTGYFHQDAIVTNDTIELQEKTKLSSATIMDGNLVLTLINNIGVIADVDFTVDEIIHKTTGQRFSKSIHLPNTSAPVTETIPLKDYQIVLPFTDLNINQVIHYTSKVSIPSDQEMTITTNQKIDVVVKLSHLEFIQVQGYLDPVQVDIAKVEQEVSALPEELNGINFHNVDICLEFQTNIGVPVELNLFITAKAENGDSVRKEIKQEITSNPLVVVPDAEDLINIKPKKIVASGYALVGGTGSVDTAQYVKGIMHITVPFEMKLTQNAKMDIEPSLIKQDIPEEVESASIYVDVKNELEIGGRATILAALDTLFFESDSPIAPDTLATINLYPDSSFLEIVSLPKEKIALFKDSLYVKTIVNLMGKTDAAGNPLPSRFLRGQQLKILGYAQIKGMVEFADKND